MKTIVMACANYWTTPFQVGSHHIARGFAKKGWKVAFISDPISLVHLARLSPSTKERLEIYRAGGIEDGNIWAYVPGALVTPQRFFGLRSRWLHRHWSLFNYPSVVARLKKRGFDQPDLLYFDSPLQGFLHRELHPKSTLYRMADYNKGFRRNASAKGALEEELVQQVDCCVYTAESLHSYVASLSPQKMEYLPNGVDLAHFSKEYPRPHDYQYFHGPIALYVGAIHEWFDYTLLVKAAEAFPAVQFVIIGSGGKKRVSLPPNVHFLGPRSWHDIPAYMQHASIGLIPFDVAGYPDLIHRVNPLKLYEYIASNLPVVATAWEELDRLHSPALLAHSSDAFIRQIEQALQSEVDREFVRQHGWDARVDQLLALYHNLEKKALPGPV